MTRRGKRSSEKKKEKETLHHGRFPIPPPPADQGPSASCSTGEGNGDSSGSSNDEVPAVYDARKQAPADPILLRQLPKCPKISKMFCWTAAQYEQYDEYLIAKWRLFGFPSQDRVYVSIRDPNSRVAHIAKTRYNEPRLVQNRGRR